MKCPECFFINEDERSTCQYCGADLPLDDSAEALEDLRKRRKTNQAKKQVHQALAGAGRLISNIFFFILYTAVTIIGILAILFILVRQCAINWPVAPGWNSIPKEVSHYWNWLDEWQAKRCPDLPAGNYFFGDEPVPPFNETAETDVKTCENAVITFTPQSAPAGTTLEIALGGFPRTERVKACWYFPSNKLDNCLDLQIDGEGRAETVYLSDGNYPKGEYRMEVEVSCGVVQQGFALE